jgi:NTP pyrophosphatase (non-canonical NTP hydrolase)
MMHLNDMVRLSFADSQKWFPKMHYEKNVEELLIHFALGLAGEAGEVANKVKKFDSGTYETWAEFVAECRDELADVIMYVFDLAAVMGVDLEEEYQAKRTVNGLRFPKEGQRLDG